MRKQNLRSEAAIKRAIKFSYGNSIYIDYRRVWDKNLKVSDLVLFVMNPDLPFLPICEISLKDCVKTSRQEIFVAISSTQSCCEHWGYLVMNDEDKEAFVGAELREITTTDTALKTEALENLKSEYVSTDECVFVNLETDRGTLQFAAYNSHNGCYGHEVVIRSEQLKLETTI